ncbi:hypothetical protein, partial [Acinetobacter baumannii]|uniref:hypothetical protein n=1 Tax=Acinetobacter baumannii TaxID=470 RepID=UPI00148F0235
KKAAAGGELENVTNEQKAISKAYGNTFYIPFDDEVFNDVSPFCPNSINDNVIVEFRLAEAKDVVISSDTSASYEISDLHLEWDGINDASLAQEVASQYQSGFGVHYDRVQFLRK